MQDFAEFLYVIYTNLSALFNSDSVLALLLYHRRLSNIMLLVCYAMFSKQNIVSWLLTFNTILSTLISGGMPSRKSSKPFSINVHDDPTNVPEHCLDFFGLMYFVASLSLYLKKP